MLIIIDNFVQFFVVFPPHPLIQLVCLLLIGTHSCMQPYSDLRHIHSDRSAWKIQTNVLWFWNCHWWLSLVWNRIEKYCMIKRHNCFKKSFQADLYFLPNSHKFWYPTGGRAIPDLVFPAGGEKESSPPGVSDLEDFAFSNANFLFHSQTVS